MCDLILINAEYKININQYLDTSIYIQTNKEN